MVVPCNFGLKKSFELNLFGSSECDSERQSTRFLLPIAAGRENSQQYCDTGSLK